MDKHTSEQPSTPARLTMHDLWQVVKRRRLLIGTFVAVCTLGVAAYSYIMPVTYSAGGSLMPPESDKGGGLSAFLQNATGGLGLGEMGQGGKAGRLVDMLKSRSVAELALDSSGIATFADYRIMTRQQRIEAVRDAMHFEMTSNGLVLGNCSISTTYFAGAKEKEQARQLSAALLNASFHALDMVNREKSVSRARKTREYIERYLAINKKRLDSTQSVLQAFSKKHKILALEEQTSAIVENAVTIGAQISKTEVELDIARAELNSASPVVEQLERKLKQLRSQYERIQSGGLTDNDEFSIPLNTMAEIGRTYANLIRDVKILEQINAYLESQRAQEAIQEQRDVPVVEVLDPAIPPERRSSPKRSFMVASTVVLSGLLACVLVFFIEVRRSKVYKNMQVV